MRARVFDDRTDSMLKRSDDALVNELAPIDRLFFKMLFTGKLYRKIYRMYELKA